MNKIWSSSEQAIGSVNPVVKKNNYSGAICWFCCVGKKFVHIRSLRVRWIIIGLVHVDFISKNQIQNISRSVVTYLLIVI